MAGNLSILFGVFFNIHCILSILILFALWNAISIIQLSYILNLSWIQNEKLADLWGKVIAIGLAIGIPTATEVIQVCMVSCLTN